MSTLLLPDSTACNISGEKFALSTGNILLFLSIAAYLLLTMLGQWKYCPDWIEGYKLWELMQQRKRKLSGNMERDRMNKEEVSGFDAETGNDNVRGIRKERVGSRMTGEDKERATLTDQQSIAEK